MDDLRAKAGIERAVVDVLRKVGVLPPAPPSTKTAADRQTGTMSPTRRTEHEAATTIIRSRNAQKQRRYRDTCP
jgi:hypothetical protein